VGARSKARKRAVDVLYEAAQRDDDAVQTLRDRLAQSDPPIPEYAVELVEGVVAHRPRIDELLSTYAEEWTLDRMPPVDLAILRLGRPRGQPVHRRQPRVHQRAARPDPDAQAEPVDLTP
jgi:N utilization substance protein B